MSEPPDVYAAPKLSELNIHSETSLKILHFFKGAFPEALGGIEQVIHQLSVGAVNHGVQSDVLALSHESATTRDYHGYRVHTVKTSFELASTGFSLAAFKRFAQLADEADVVHYHYPWPFMDLVHLVTRCKKPSLVTYHSDIVRQKRLLQLYRPLQQHFLRAMDNIVVTSPNYLATSTELIPFRDKTHVIPIGLEKDNYPPVDAVKQAAWRQRLGERFFLFVGVIRYYKGLHILVEAARGSSYPIVIVGAGPIEKELKKQAEKLGVTNIHFLGALPEEDKVALLDLCTALVFPSHLRSEAFGISLLEGAMYGKPLISSEIGTGTTYINIHNETGLVVPPENPAELRVAMDYLWNNTQEAAAMGRRAADRYRELFTAERMTAKYVELYRQLASR